jgi:hypothetical protein
MAISTSARRPTGIAAISEISLPAVGEQVGFSFRAHSVSALACCVVMALSGPTRVALGGASVLLLGGLLGLAWWSWHRKSGREPATRFRRIHLGLAAGALALIAVGAVWRLVVAIQSTPACSPARSATP